MYMWLDSADVQNNSDKIIESSVKRIANKNDENRGNLSFKNIKIIAKYQQLLRHS